MTKPQIVFFGTGPVSLQTLEGIHGAFDIEAIITKPDRIIHGRLHDHPVKTWAAHRKIAVHQVENREELGRLFSDSPFTSRVGLVVDFGIFIPKSVIEYFPFGIVNSHFSLLPQWRGADPISFALLSGQKTSGVSLMLVDEKMDEGPLIAQEEFAIPLGIYNEQFTRELADLSNRLLIEVLPGYLAGKVKPWAQDSAAEVTYSRKLSKDDGVIDWQKSADEIDREIRTFTPWPGSRTTLLGREVIITKAHPTDRHVLAKTVAGTAEVDPEEMEKSGFVISSHSGFLAVICGHGALVIDHLKPVGKREMAAADFTRGILR
jgi:methionyl-tRNA formyltransferase